MRIRLYTTAITVAFFLGASGCTSGSDPGAEPESGSADQPSSEPESGSADQPVTLSYGIWDQNQASALEEVAAGFERDNPGIEVDVQVTPWGQYWTKLQAAAGGGAAPDVFWMNGPNFQLYASNGVLAPLSEQITKDGVDTSVFPESLNDLYSLDGEQYGLSKDFDTIGLWYNKELFDAAGVEYPDESWTWDDLHEAAAKLTDQAEGQFGITAALEGQQDYYNTILQAGGYVISEDGTTSGFADPATIEGLRFWTDLIDAGSSPTLQQMTDTSPLQWFGSGKTAMFYGGSWNVAEFKNNEYTADKVDVAPLPQGEERAVVIHGLANVMGADTDHPDEAWKFVEYLGSEQAAQILAGAGTAIPAYDGTQQAWLDASPAYDLQVFLDAAEYAHPLPVSANTAVWNAEEATHLTPAWTGEMDIADAAAQLADAMNAALADEAR